MTKTPQKTVATESEQTVATSTKTWSYLLRVFISFVLVILLLDLAWSRLSNQASLNHTETYWQETFLSSTSLLLKNSAASDYDTVALELSSITGLEVAIESLDQLHQQTSGSSKTPQSQLVTINHQRYLLATYPQSNSQIRLGPLPKESRWLPIFVTLGFYVIIAMLIWIWLRPLVTGLDRLSEMTSKFALNYQEPLPELKVRSPVKELASSIESMAHKIRLLLQTQIELTGGLSHEIRTPLARIKFALATARGEMGNRRQFDSIDKDILELEQLVEAMLDYSRLQQTQSILKWRSIDANRFLTQIADKYQWRTKAKVNVDISDMADLPAQQPTIAGDQRLIHLALSNLVVNATRYARDHITITLSIEHGRQVLRVFDDGPGIPTQNRKQTLQPFQKNTSDGGHSDGFGLGLAIVQRIALLHGGGITLDSSPLGGLEVTFRWPLTQPD